MSNKSSLEVFEHVSLMTLDSLLRCIFGQCTDVQTTESVVLPHLSILNRMCGFRQHNDYTKNIYEMADLVTYRIQNPLIHSDFTFNLTPSGRRFRQCCKAIHEFTQGVINARKQEKQNMESTHQKYLNFIDILLEAKVSEFLELGD